MLNTLTMRNARRSAGDYLIYLGTMALIATLMFAFHGMIFSADMRALYAEMQVFAALIGVASVFIIVIVVWLVRYMVNFMLEKRSREFGTYLLLGMSRKQIAGVFRREHMLLGLAALLIGILPGMAAQKIFVNVFYAILETEYQISLDLSPWGILLTLGVMGLAYVLALAGIGRKFRNMQIRDFIALEKQNEQAMRDKGIWKAAFLFVSIAYIIVFNVLAMGGNMNEYSVWAYIAGLIAAVYLLYIGLSAFFVGYIKAKRAGLYKGANIFILRQLASKIKTMRFTIGTLTLLFTAALLGWTVVMMVADYQKNEMDKQIPFEVAIFSDRPDADFAEQLAVIHENAALRDAHIYNIYANDTNAINDYLYANVQGTWRNEIFVDGKMGGSTYFGYDTFMGLTDYNRIRAMIGLAEVALNDGEYILHGKEKIDEQLIGIRDTVPVIVGGRTLNCQAIYMEPLQQHRMNGADYIVVVNDALLPALRPYYSVMVGAFQGDVPPDLQIKLKDTQHFLKDAIFDSLYEIEIGEGSNQVLFFSDDVMVAENLKIEGNFTIVAVCFILAYLGIVFLCAALTIMAVQQLSDAAKFRFRYDILKKLGMNKRETEKVVLKQLAVYYLCPYIISIVLSVFIGLFISERFVYFTGIQAGNYQYYILALLMFTVVYAAYYIISYVGFIRNLERR